MSRKPIICPVSSTPHPQRLHDVFALFEDIKLSPIIEPSQHKVSSQPKPTSQSTKPGVAKGTGAVRKRRILEEKAAPESVDDAVIRQLGAKAEDICSNALSQSRNLYNMFPQPIILDSDEEEEEEMFPTVSSKKLLKKSKQENKTTDAVKSLKTGKNKHEDKIDRPVPGSNRRLRSTRLAVDKELQRRASSQPSESGSSTTKNSKFRAKKKENQPIISAISSPSVIILDNEDNLGLKSGCKKRHNVLLSEDLEEKVPIQWSERRKRAVETSNEVPGIENSEVYEVKCEKINIKKRKIEAVKSKKILSNGAVPKCIVRSQKNNDADVKISSYGEKKFPPGSISRFEDIKFKFNKNCGAIIAQCLKTESHDIGYLEVSQEETFNGQRSNITFVVLEGRAKVIYLGISEELSPGDILHISKDSGYQFQCVGENHVRFLYCKGH